MKADYLIQNGRVIDPYRGIDEIRTVACKDGVIVSSAEVTDAEEIVELIRPELGPLIIQKLCGVREPLG